MAYDAVDFDLYMTTGGRTVPLTAFSCSYELNKIPSANVVLPVGIRHDTLLPSDSHALFSELGLFLQPVQIWMNARRRPGGGFASPFPVTGAPFILFEGFITGPGYRKSTNSFGLSLTVIHWLEILTYSSTLSSISHPGNPIDFTFNAILDATNKAGGDYTYVTMAQKTLGVHSLTTDIWERGIKPWFIELAMEDRLTIQDLGVVQRRQQEGEEALRPDVLRALARIHSSKKAPLKLVIKSDIETQMAANLIKELSDSTLNPTNSIPGMSSTTFWNKMVGDVGANLFFSLVPRATDAVMVPFVAGLRSFYDPYGDGMTVWARDIDYIDLGGALTRPVRAVALYSDTAEAIAGDYNTKEPNMGRKPQLVGSFQGLKHGMVVVQRSPRFLATLNAMGDEHVRSTLLKPETSATPGVDQTPAGESPRDKQEKARTELKTVRSRFAQALYAFEVLKGRSGQINGTFRMDIAPGSTIRVEGIGAGTPSVYASVMKVNMVLNADSQQSSTTYQLAHIRTELENELDTLSVERHPLYDSTWVGDTLFGGTDVPDPPEE